MIGSKDGTGSEKSIRGDHNTVRLSWKREGNASTEGVRGWDEHQDDIVDHLAMVLRNGFEHLYADHDAKQGRKKGVNRAVWRQNMHSLRFVAPLTRAKAERIVYPRRVACTASLHMV